MDKPLTQKEMEQLAVGDQVVVDHRLKTLGEAEIRAIHDKSVWLKPMYRPAPRYSRAQILLAQVRQVLVHGCGDGQCVIKRPKGQHTNGGCRCLRRLPEDLREAARWLDEEPWPCGQPMDIPEVHQVTEEDLRQAFGQASE